MWKCLQLCIHGVAMVDDGRVCLVYVGGYNSRYPDLPLPSSHLLHQLSCLQTTIRDCLQPPQQNWHEAEQEYRRLFAEALLQGTEDDTLELAIFCELITAGMMNTNCCLIKFNSETSELLEQQENCADSYLIE